MGDPGEEPDELPKRQLTTAAAFKRLWPVPRERVKKEFGCGMKMIRKYVKGLPLPSFNFWSQLLPAEKRIIPDDVKRLLEMNDSDLEAYRQKVLSESWPPA